MKSIHKSAWLLAALSGVLQVLLFPRPNLYWLCWVALAPLMVALLRAREADVAELLSEETTSMLVPARVAQGFLLGWLSGTIFYLGSCYWVYLVMASYGGLSQPLAILLLVLFSLFIGLHHAVFGALVALVTKSRAGLTRRALVVAPFLWVGVELLRSYVVSFPWDLLGTAQIDNLPLVRLASVTGVYGISFEIALVNTVFAAAALVHKKRRTTLAIAALAGAVALQSTQLIKVEPSDVDAHATLVQQDAPIERQWTMPRYRALLDELKAISVAPPPSRDAIPPLIVWPESPAPFETDDMLFMSAASDIARGQRSWMLAGAAAIVPGKGGEDTKFYNSSLLFNPEGAYVTRYDKVHLVPWGEYIPFSWAFGFAKTLTREVGTFTSGGTERMPLEIGAHRYGIIICYELAFPHEVRQFVLHGGEVLINSGNDGWYGNSGAAWQLLNMSRMRAVENHRWVMRDTNTGITSSIDPYGRVVAQAPRNRRLVFSAPYGMMNDTTLYTRYGDWFPLLCAIISLVGLLWPDRAKSVMGHPATV